MLNECIVASLSSMKQRHMYPFSVHSCQVQNSFFQNNYDTNLIQNVELLRKSDSSSKLFSLLSTEQRS